MENKHFQIDSLKYATDEKYRNEFIEKFNNMLNRKVKKKEIIQEIIDNDFDIKFVGNPENYNVLRYELDSANDNKKNIITNVFFLKNEIRKEIKCVFIKGKRKWILKNKNEVCKQFYEVLLSNEYDIAWIKTFLERMETIKNIILDDRERLKGIPDSSIYDVQKIFYENACNIVTHFPKYFFMLFQFEDFIKNIEKKKHNILPFEEKKITNKFYQHITDISNIDKRTVGQRYRDFKRKKLIPNFSKKFLPIK